MISRRTLLAAGAVAATGVVAKIVADAGVSLASSTAPVRALASAAGRATFVSWSVPMPVAPVLRPVQTAGGVDVYRLPMVDATTEILPGRPTPVRTFGGGFVGPTIRARTGRPVRLVVPNQLHQAAANVHLHGGHVPASSDGYPMDLIEPGAQRVYDYPNLQQGASLWYHDHSHHTESENVYLGLHGSYILEDPAESSLNLPTGAYDIPIAFRDAHVDENGQLIFDLNEDPRARTTVLVNGKPQPRFAVAGRRYRFRFLNSSNERILRLHLDDGTPLVQIGTDGGLLPAPVARTEVTFGSAERVDIVIDFARCRAGSSVLLVDADAGPLLRFDVDRRISDPSRVPDTLRALPAMPPPIMTRDVTMNFGLVDGVPTISQINGKQFDPNRIDFRVKAGSTEIWNIHNGDGAIGLAHTFHLHQTNFRVLNRSTGPAGIDDAGLKDTVLVPPGESVSLHVTFSKYLGKYMFHCHFLEHSSLGMMAQMEVVP